MYDIMVSFFACDDGGQDREKPGEQSNIRWRLDRTRSLGATLVLHTNEMLGGL